MGKVKKLMLIVIVIISIVNTKGVKAEEESTDEKLESILEESSTYKEEELELMRIVEEKVEGFTEEDKEEVYSYLLNKKDRTIEEEALLNGMMNKNNEELIGVLLRRLRKVMTVITMIWVILVITKKREPEES